MNLSLERKIALGFISSALVLLLVTAAAWWNFVHFRGTHYWVERSRDVLSHLDQATSNVLAMQSSVRGFVLTGSDDVLAPFSAGAPRLEENLAQLRALTAENEAQLARVARLPPLADHAREIMVGRIESRRRRGLDAAAETSAYLEGQRAVEEFRAVVRELVTEERRLLDARLARNVQAGRLTVFTIVCATVLALTTVTLASIRVRRDLLKQREAESVLRESYERIEDLYNHAPCGYQSLDEAGRFLAINDTALTWLGYTRAEVLGRMSFSDVLTPESASVFADRFARFKHAGAVQNVDYTLRRKDGSTLPVLLNATAIYDAAGRFIASRATVFDVTLRKRLEDERDRYFTMSGDLLSVTGFDGCLKRVNPAWEQTLGFAEAELLARSHVEWVHPEDREAVLAATARLVAGQEQIDFDCRYRCRDGSFRWLHWSARAAAAERLVYASARDITERKEADQRIRQLNTDLSTRARQLEAANQELESFSYSVSHDLRAPLRHIDGFASLLGKRAAPTLDEESRRFLAIISKSAKQMGALIDDLLAFSRIGRARLRLEPVDQNRLVAEVISEGRYDPTAARLVWEIEPLPAAHGDPAMLRQVWTNLLDNAVKYSGTRPQARIAIGGRAAAATGEYVFFVRDNGVGFNMDYVDKLFGVFQRLHSPAEFEGTGIGLANVRRIVTRHGGRTWAEGRPNEGATFFFTLPSRDTPAPPSQTP